MNYDDIDPVLEELSEQQLKDTIVNNVSAKNKLREDAKAYAKGAREAIKVLEGRNEECLELLQLKHS